MEVTRYSTIGKAGEDQLSIKNSRFIGYAIPVEDEEDIKTKLDDVKATHPKANHHVYAWRLGFDGQLYRTNDDGEPSGTGGRPILSQIDKRELTQVLVVVVRYFGGVKLGTGGLISAYGKTAEAALNSAIIIEKDRTEVYQMACRYEHYSEFMAFLKKYDAEVIGEEYLDECILTVRCPMRHIADFLWYTRDLASIIAWPGE